jgi:hypothetical protein
MAFKYKLFSLIARIRGKLNPIKYPEGNALWENEWRNLNADAFSYKLNSYPYLSDPLKGLIDHTASFDHFVSSKTKRGRDCDDFARMWSYWGVANDYIAREYVIINPKHPFKYAHIVTVLEKDNNYMLCNYRNYSSQPTIEKSLDALKLQKKYADGYWYALQSTFLPSQLNISKS